MRPPCFWAAAAAGQRARPLRARGASAQSAEPVTLKYVTWRLEDKEVWEALAEQFHKENPNITIEFIYSKDNSSHYMTVESNLLVGEGMDLFDSHPFADKFLKYASEGMLVDLSDTAGAERMTEGAKQLVTYQGKPLRLQLRLQHDRPGLQQRLV